MGGAVYITIWLKHASCMDVFIVYKAQTLAMQCSNKLQELGLCRFIAAMPMFPSSDLEHWYVLLIIEGTMWFFGYCGQNISTEVFAHLCEDLANNGMVSLPGASGRCYNFKCKDTEICLLAHVICFGNTMTNNKWS